MSETEPTCRHCLRTDCGLLATVIVGEHAMFEAVAECMAAQHKAAQAQPVAGRRGVR